MKAKTDTQRCYCIALRQAALAVTDFYDRALGTSGLTVNQYALLASVLKTSPCSVSALAKTMRLERTTLVRNIKPLVAGGLLEDLSPQGARDKQLVLTAWGMERLAKAQPLWENAQRDLRAVVGEENFDALLNAVDSLKKLRKR